MTTFKKTVMLAALCATGVIGSTAAMAGDTAAVAVSATVTGTCKFNSGGTVSFTLDPTSASAATGTVTQPAFWCTKGAAYSITDDVGLHKSGTIYRMKHATLADLIPYTFTYTASGSGNGKTSPITMNIASTVANVDFVNVSAGSYSDTVTLTIAP
jgi:spore coat protein U-like protein